MKTFNKISNIKEYNQYVEKNYGYVLYGYNCLNVKNDFAYWFKTKKQAIKKLELEQS